MVPAPIGAQILESYIYGRVSGEGTQLRHREKGREVGVLSSGGRPVLIWVNSDT